MAELVIMLLAVGLLALCRSILKACSHDNDKLLRDRLLLDD